MNLLALIVYGLINAAMVLSYLRRNRIYEFPFWAGAMALGWFLPQAIGGFLNIGHYPETAYQDGMIFATLCTAALWIGFHCAVRYTPAKASWLNARFDVKKLYRAGVALCLVGFFFQWKLNTLPEEMTSMTQWTGAAVKYLFLVNVFVFGFLTLWLIYLSQRRLLAPRLLVFIIPSLLLLFEAAILRGRRAAMMDLVSYLVVGLWLVRRLTVPRWMMIAGLSLGLILINSIGVYRSIMENREMSLADRASEVMKADFIQSTENIVAESGLEFNNYIFYRHVYSGHGGYDFGLVHWNILVFNYVPAQIVGRGVKESLMLTLREDKEDPSVIAKQEYGHSFGTGTTSTGYCDAFGSFGWFGFIKFLLIGWLMGVLYRHAMQGDFLGQLLYVFSLGTAMHVVSHSTHRILFSGWVYFFILGYPLLYWAKIKPSEGRA